MMIEDVSDRGGSSYVVNKVKKCLNKHLQGAYFFCRKLDVWNVRKRKGYG